MAQVPTCLPSIAGAALPGCARQSQAPAPRAGGASGSFANPDGAPMEGKSAPKGPGLTTTGSLQPRQRKQDPDQPATQAPGGRRFSQQLFSG